MKREEVMRQWSNWRNEMIYEKNHPQSNSQLQPTQLGQQAYREMMGQIEQELLRPEKESKNKGEVKFEKTFAEEIKSNVCPICLELMIPPKCRPMILFPCGHTFCSACLEMVEKNGGKKCALCKKVYTQKAVNVALQKLICIFTDNHQLLEKEEEKDKHTSFDFDQPPDSLDPSGQLSYYKTKLNLLSSRVNLLTTSLQASERALSEMDSSIQSLVSAEKVLYREMVEARDRLSVAEQQVRLVEETLREVEGKRDREVTKHREENDRVRLLKDTLKGLQTERVKVVVLLNGLGDKGAA